MNIIEHTLEQLSKYPSLTIRIGTDSQDWGRETVYVTAIVFRYARRGAHYIYYKEKVPRVKVEYMRLYDEGVRTIQCFEMLTGEIPISVEGLEFDYADIKRTLSSKLVSDFKGWSSGINQRALFKSGDQIATKAADHICRR